MVLLNVLVREGVAIYVNNIEVLRYNLDFHIQNNPEDPPPNPSPSSAVYECDSATNSFAYPRYVSATVSHQYFRTGTNIIAVEIHNHVRRERQFYFAMTAMLLATSEYVYNSPYPSIHASTNVREG